MDTKVFMGTRRMLENLDLWLEVSYILVYLVRDLQDMKEEESLKEECQSVGALTQD